MITISGLTKRYGEVQAVQDLSLCFPQRSVTIIHGPSGGGKTTLLRLIAGLEIPDAGEIRIGEKLASTPEGLLAPSKRGIGFVFQSPSLWPHLTVAQNILYGLHGLTKQGCQEQLDGILERISLEGLEGRYPAQLSGGQARRVSLARTLIVKPKRLLLDEPLTHVDPILRSQLVAFIRDYVRDAGATLLYVTHYLDEVVGLSGRVLCLADGRIAQEDEAGAA